MISFGFILPPSHHHPSDENVPKLKLVIGPHFFTFWVLHMGCQLWYLIQLGKAMNTFLVMGRLLGRWNRIYARLLVFIYLEPLNIHVRLENHK
jgi:hypothetical protein